MSDLDPIRLRSRAASVRRLAARIERVPLPSLLARCGDETWRGPAAIRFTDDVTRSWRALSGAAEDLVAQAVVLERRAQSLELAARTGAAPR